MKKTVHNVIVLIVVGSCFNGCHDDEFLASQECVNEMSAVNDHLHGYGCKPQEYCEIFNTKSDKTALCVMECCRNDGSLQCPSETQCMLTSEVPSMVYRCVPEKVIPYNSNLEPIDPENRGRDYIDSCRSYAASWNQKP